MSDVALTMRGPIHGTKDARKVAIGSSVGAVIETYDFIGFGTAAALYFGHAFFPGASPVAGTLASFATLGVGFAARPLGGIVGGHLGDKLGRKPVLVASLIVMGLATFVHRPAAHLRRGGHLGADPAGHRAHHPGRGVRRRMGRGDPDELRARPVATKGQVHRHGAGRLPGGSAAGQPGVFGQRASGRRWAWRVPFLCSIFLVIVGLIIRAKVPESPVFEDVKEHGDIVKSPIVQVIKTDWRNILRGIGLRIAETAGYAVSDHLHDLVSEERRAGHQVRDADRAVHRPSAIGIFATMAWSGSPTRSAGAPCTCMPARSHCPSAC